MEKPLTRPFFIRNLDAGQVLETFLVSAVAAFLGVRFFLGVTGYPRLGGGGLHIAHMLWGGTLVVAAVLLLLSYLGQRIRWAAAGPAPEESPRGAVAMDPEADRGCSSLALDGSHRHRRVVDQAAGGRNGEPGPCLCAQRHGAGRNGRSAPAARLRRFGRLNARRR